MSTIESKDKRFFDCHQRKKYPLNHLVFMFVCCEQTLFYN